MIKLLTVYLFAAHYPGITKPQFTHVMILAVILYYYVPLLCRVRFVRAANWSIITRRFAGYVLSTLAVMLFYCSLSEYRAGFYAPYFVLIFRFWPIFYALSLAYFYLYYRASVDNACRYGRLLDSLLIGKPDLQAVRELALQYGVKMFFLPLMYLFSIRGDVPSLAVGSLKTLYDFIMYWDVLFAVVGYLITLRLFDTHIRSVDQTLDGILIALICYPPLNHFFFGTYFKTSSTVNWLTYDNHILHAVVLSLAVVYVWATVAFGPTFSNLTYRGLVVRGPYRYCAHPAYLAKNLFWWFQKLPLMNVDPVANVVHLLATNAIYWYRAKTEERHLSRYPEYRRYLHGLRLQRAVFLDRLFGLRGQLRAER